MIEIELTEEDIKKLQEGKELSFNDNIIIGFRGMEIERNIEVIVFKKRD